MKKIAAIFAHPDDEILGCGGTLAKHKLKKDKVDVCFLSSGLTARKKNSINLNEHNTQARNANKILNVDSINFFDFPDNSLDSVLFLKIVKKIEDFIFKKKPNIIYTHHVGDLNIDHEIVHKAVLTATRPIGNSQVKEIYACEVNSSTEWAYNSKNFFSPTYFINIDETIDIKINALNEYKSELRIFPHPRSLEGVRYLAKYRGMQSGFQNAEAFMEIRRFKS